LELLQNIKASFVYLEYRYYINSEHTYWAREG